uniref:Uncharacterized protein n=1 Tax=Triticum urartu TaxID=4572 RepID=A0A8R7QZB1_TRIUA
MPSFPRPNLNYVNNFARSDHKMELSRHPLVQ